MLHQIVIVGPLQCNCSILACEDTKEAIIIDPGAEPEKILRQVQAAGLTVKYLVHTHAHFDHIGATGAVKEKLQSTICLHREDKLIYDNLPMQGQMFGMHFSPAPAVDKFIEDEEILTFGKHRAQVIHTPGHSPGGVCIKLLDGDESVFSGDSLFRESIGRTDLWGGDGALLIRSIKDRLLTLPTDTPVFPGHGPATEIGYEKTRNPFL